MLKTLNYLFIASITFGFAQKSKTEPKKPADSIQKLDEVIITPTTKGETDELIDAEGIVSSGLMTLDEWETCKRYAFTLFRYGQDVAAENGMILVDTKYEFGKDQDGNIVLIDEIHTPEMGVYYHIAYSYPPTGCVM